MNPEIPEPSPARDDDTEPIATPDETEAQQPEPTLAQMIGEAVANGLFQVLSQVPVKTAQLKCATCLATRLAWMTANAGPLKAAEAQMITIASAMAEDDPRRAQLNPLMFMAPGSPPAPPVQDGLTMHQGSLYCPVHFPMPAQPGRKEILVVQGALSSSLIAEVMKSAA